MTPADVYFVIEICSCVCCVCAHNLQIAWEMCANENIIIFDVACRLKLESYFFLFVLQSIRLTVILFVIIVIKSAHLSTYMCHCSRK